MEERILKELYQKISKQKEIISEIFSKWWQDKHPTAKDKQEYYHAKAKIRLEEKRIIECVQKNAATEYVYYNSLRVSEECEKTRAERAYED